MYSRVSIRYRVRTVEYFKFPNPEGAVVWEKLINKGRTENEKKIFLKNQKNSNINVKNYKTNIKIFMI